MIHEITLEEGLELAVSMEQSGNKDMSYMGRVLAKRMELALENRKNGIKKFIYTSAQASAPND